MNVKPGKYRHFKGNEYQVIAVGRHSETLEKLIIYKALYESEEFGKDVIWIRPIEMFEDKKIVDGKVVNRFERIKE
ncbi:DUF1653 domain-containing protein [archaeon]|jgi:hypothetical protein|nr:DUF1653 domain-containing protein [archaeon]MBT4352391.1 DUF1653 domain-containing protein [archaeon]MBT4648320.1 DUF1653 domain-containing protein [archaeon]MBT6822309.1 DUF1653 domain-containing protein [archaeon]MBT7391796.1 DUF1653 domain-containing protein [archaeon]